MPDPYGNQNSIGSTGLPDGNTPQQQTPGGGKTFDSGAFNPTGPWKNRDQTGGKMLPQQGAIYGGIYNQAEGMGGYFNGLAQGYNQNAPQIGAIGQLDEAQKYYHDLMQGDGGYAQNQFRQSQDQSIAAQMAMANSARGGAAAHAGAMRAATQGAGAQMAAGANQAAQIASQEEQAGAQGMAGIGAQQLARQQNNAALQQQNQQQINSMQTALYGMGEQEQGLGLSSQQAYMANLLAAEGINTQQSQFNTQLGTQIAGAGIQAAGVGIGAAASDVNLKTDVQPQGAGGIGSLYGGATPGIIGRPDYAHALNEQPQLVKPDNAAAVGTGVGVGAGTGALSGAATGGPVGAALGGAGGALQGGLGAASKTDPHDQGMRMASVGTQAGVGAASGAAMGSAAGPWGTAIGGVVGGVAGLVKGLMT